VALFRRKNESTTAQLEPDAVGTDAGAGAGKKGRTPTRKEAEAARRERLTKKVTKQDAARMQRNERQKALQARDATPEKALLRDYIDSRRSLGEFLLPGMVVILGASFAYSIAPTLSLYATVFMYIFIAAVLVDMFLMWRGFKKLLAERLPRSSSRGLLFYGANRSIQIRRFRMPAPRIKRGESF
jgi:hypothetical protein